MEKPVPQTKTALVWNDVEAYILEKYGRDPRDWDNKFPGRRGKRTGIREGAEYQDFWHWIVDRCHPPRGGYFTLYFPMDDQHLEPQWVLDIHKIIFEEFGDQAKPSMRAKYSPDSITFFVAW